MLKGKAIVGQAGGPTSVINASLAGIVEAARDVDDITGVLGMRWGIEGFMAGEVVDLSAEAPDTIAALRRTPSSALGSSRHTLRDEDFPVILERLRAHDVRTIFTIGGNGTMAASRRVTAYAAEQGYPMCGIGVPKTVDNDLVGTDHTLGYGSAARYVALSVQQGGRLARDMQKVDQFVIYQSIGRDAGWLTAASALAKRDEADAPHLIYLPERVFDREAFLAAVDTAYTRYGFVAIACGEGLKYADGTPVSAPTEPGKFASAEYGAMGGGSVGVNLHRLISETFGWRGEFQITESLCMAAIDRASDVDLEEAYQCGRAAVGLAVEETGDVMVSLVRTSNDPYACTIAATPLPDAAPAAKLMPDRFINAEGNFTTEAFAEYLRPLVGDLPVYAELAYRPVAT